MIDKEFIKTKLSSIQSYYYELEKIISFNDEEIKNDFIKLRALERIIQLIVDEIIDINNHFIRYFPLPLPKDFQSSFLILAEGNIMPYDFAQKIASVVGLRNRLVHRYERIDISLLIEIIRKNRHDFKAYVNYIFKFIENY